MQPLFKREVEDCLGVFLGATTKVVPFIQDPTHLEALVIIEGINLAAYGFQQVWFESDALEVISVLNIRELGWPYLHHFRKENLILCSSFQDFSFNWVPRSGNMAAHSLVKSISLDDSYRTWHELPLCHTSHIKE